jgi:hypothetical protein
MNRLAKNGNPSFPKGRLPQPFAASQSTTTGRLDQFMQEKTTAEEWRSKTFAYLFAKHAAISNSSGSPLDPYVMDRFLVRLPLRYYDSDLDSPPTVQQVNTLVKLGVPRWPLINQGVNERGPCWKRDVRKDLLLSPKPGSCATEGTPAPGLLNLPKSGPSYTTSGGKK